MLSISSKSIYGISAMLALAENHGVGYLPLKEISSSGNIPHQYLEQIFNRLGKAGLVRSVRGKNGGYQLAADPEAITVLDIVMVLEGGIDLFPPGESAQPDVVAEIFTRAQECLKKNLSVSLADMALRRQAIQDTLVFDI